MSDTPSTTPHLLQERLAALAQHLSTRDDALALLALGSVGVETERLDAGSDLDFFVLVRDGAKGHYLLAGRGALGGTRRGGRADPEARLGQPRRLTFLRTETSGDGKLGNLGIGGASRRLVKACEKLCRAECCGIDAFDFSPLHMASHLSAYTGDISEADLEAIEQDLDALAASANQRPPDENGLVASIEGTNQYFTKEGLDKLIHQIRVNVRLAPKVLEYSDRLQEDAEK